MMQLMSIGSDFELGLLHNDKPFSVEGLVGGTKASPRWIHEDLGNMQEDNVLLEGAIVPCYDRQTFVSKMQEMSTYLHHFAAERQLKIATECSLEYDEDQLMSRQAQEFGCDIDYNSWTQMPNPRPNAATNRRSAGGHVHVGVEADAGALFTLGKAMDAFITVPLMLVMSRAQRRLEIERRVLYGKAGAIRLKPYGLEYRTLSNQWTFDDKLISFVYDSAAAAVRFIADGHADMLEQSMIVPVINRGQRPDLGYYYSLPGWGEV